MKRHKPEIGTKMKIVLITSDSLRHKYIAAAISEKISLKLVVSEAKSAKIQDTEHLTSKDAEFIKAHFEAREKSEAEYFGRFKNFPSDVPLLKVPFSGVNSSEIQKEICTVNPDFIVLFGSSIINDTLLQKFPQRVINLHLGLSPYYKGSATNLFPFYYEEPECVGATIHLATSKVDEGAVLHQLRPKMEESDTLHDIGNKTIVQAGKILPEIIELYSEKKIIPKSIEEEEGKIFRNKDLNPSVLRQVYLNFEKGMIPDYLKIKKEKDAKTPLIKSL